MTESFPPDYFPAYFVTPEIIDCEPGFTIKKYADGTEVWFSPSGTQTNFANGNVTVEKLDSQTYSGGKIALKFLVEET